MKIVAKITGFLLFALLVGCKMTKRVPEGEFLLNKNVIEVEAKKPKFEVPTWDLEDIIKQQENRHIIRMPGWSWLPKPNQPRLRYKLSLYNLPNPERMERARDRKVRRRTRRLLRKNERLRRKGKDTLEWSELDTTIFRDAIRETAGEPPVILDTSKVSTTTRQMRIWMVKNGWFDAEVRDSIVYDSSKQLANVYYIVKPNQPYTVRKMSYDVPDTRLMSFVRFMIEKDSIIHSGDKFSVDELNYQRKWITGWCKNQGLYSFGKDYIYYKVDSAVGNHQVDITLKVKNPRIPHPTIEDSLIEGRHERYYYRDVIYYIGYEGDDLSQYDTVHYRGYIFAYKGDKPRLKPRSLLRGILIQPGGLYEEDSVSITYKRLNNLGVFKSITIRFKLGDRVKQGYNMDCLIQLSFRESQGIRFQANGTNEGGNLGVSGSFLYHHNNVFRGAERLELGFTGGLEIQQLLVTKEESEEDETKETFFSRSTPFNTVEYGPEIGLQFPRWLFLPGAFRNADHLSTEFKIGLNQQIRPDFKRTVQNFSWNYSLVPAPHINWKISVWELSALKINKSQAFIRRLDSLDDPILNTSYQDHIISSLKVSFTYSEFNNPVAFGHQRNKVYFNIFGAMAGQLPRVWSEDLAPTVSDWVNSDITPGFDSISDSYEILGIRFAQYFKFSVDIRDYYEIAEGVTQVFRIAGGLGLPGKNLKQALPFEKAFFSGGPNGLRAWKARSLGPGTYLDSSLTRRYDRIGDIKLEGNIETRIDFDLVELAFFIDAGNIWLKNKSKRSGSQFTRDFYKELAVGGGIGIRFDLDFFIVRFDIAKPLRDPALDPGERWWFQDKTNINQLRYDVQGPAGFRPYRAPWNLNLGIGYPF